MKKLTKIERFDQRIPGLADQVKVWFDQGVTALRVSELLRQQYSIPVTESTAGSFRTRRWVPEQDRLCEQRLATLADAEISREEAFRASLASGFFTRVK